MLIFKWVDQEGKSCRTYVSYLIMKNVLTNVKVLWNTLQLYITQLMALITNIIIQHRGSTCILPVIFLNEFSQGWEFSIILDSVLYVHIWSGRRPQSSFSENLWQGVLWITIQLTNVKEERCVMMFRSYLQLGIWLERGRLYYPFFWWSVSTLCLVDHNESWYPSNGYTLMGFPV